MVFLAVSFVLIIAWTWYRIWVFRKGIKVRRMLERLVKESERSPSPPPPTTPSS